ncbi:hypothetical protein FN846DRAFT_1020030 [Sphaerosporella brunnea]|uniref:Uncharacterized protein n=1 Tax=Sphaerosporella brunnea TaxID=1250544 RepID=A0A5J5F3Q7_9PEZI|nr:hypothetical protein FN846DRAFT_1020030 [Sphaerosporella brunnea]
MPPQRMKPTKQECLQCRQNPLRRPSPVRTSAPPVEGDGTDDTMNINGDDAHHVENAMLRAELANVRDQLADVRQLAKAKNPLRRPSPVRTSAPPVEGDGTDDTMNADNDDALHVENAMLRAELANVPCFTNHRGARSYHRRAKNPLRRPSPVRTSAPPVEGDGTDDTMNADNDDALHVENAMLRAELANVRARLDDVCDQHAKLASRIIAEQDRTIAERDRTVAELKAALEDEKTRQLDGNDLTAVGWGNFGVLTSADADLEPTYLPSEMTVFWFKHSSSPWSSRLTRHGSPVSGVPAFRGGRRHASGGCRILSFNGVFLPCTVRSIDSFLALYG